MEAELAHALLECQSVLAQGRMLVSLLIITGASQTLYELVSLGPEYERFKKEYLLKNKYSPGQVNPRPTPLYNDIEFSILRL
jgi:hypothetical protein